MPHVFKAARSRILSKALLGTGTVVAASVVLLSGLFLLRHEAAFRRQLELRAEALARSLAAQSQFALLMANRDELRHIATSALDGSADVLYVAVEDAAGRNVASAAREPAYELPAGAAPVRQAATRVVRIGPHATRCVEASAPSISHAEGGLFGLAPADADALGRVRVAMSLASQTELFFSTLRYVGAISSLIFAVALALQYFAFRRLLAPLAELAGVANAVARGEFEGLRAVKRSGDEIGVLVDSFNGMLDQIAERTGELHRQVDEKERARAELTEAQHRLIDLSRRSGMAEVATGVLHNVGNVLNSVNVSATLISGKVKDSRADKLGALVGMLQQHSGQLDGYLREDPKGQRVLPYLEKLAAHLQQERDLVLNELGLLTRHIDHIKQIVATQQNYARVSGLVEETCLSELAEDALRIAHAGFQSRAITILRDFEDIPRFASDKHQILQILLNLFRNASRAIADAERPEKVIRVRIRRHGADRVRLEVRDSGVGLAREDLTRIFGHGFTTKADGHGFGLHSGALAAKQLGGALWAESDGPGHGATFILEMPTAGSPAQKEGSE